MNFCRATIMTSDLQTGVDATHFFIGGSLFAENEPFSPRFLYPLRLRKRGVQQHAIPYFEIEECPD